MDPRTPSTREQRVNDPQPREAMPRQPIPPSEAQTVRRTAAFVDPYDMRTEPEEPGYGHGV